MTKSLNLFSITLTDFCFTHPIHFIYNIFGLRVLFHNGFFLIMIKYSGQFYNPGKEYCLHKAYFSISEFYLVNSRWTCVRAVTIDSDIKSVYREIPPVYIPFSTETYFKEEGLAK